MFELFYNLHLFSWYTPVCTYGADSAPGIMCTHAHQTELYHTQSCDNTRKMLSYLYKHTHTHNKTPSPEQIIRKVNMKLDTTQTTFSSLCIAYLHTRSPHSHFPRDVCTFLFFSTQFFSVSSNWTRTNNFFLCLTCAHNIHAFIDPSLKSYGTSLHHIHMYVPPSFCVYTHAAHMCAGWNAVCVLWCDY